MNKFPNFAVTRLLNENIEHPKLIINNSVVYVDADYDSFKHIVSYIRNYDHTFDKSLENKINHDMKIFTVRNEEVNKMNIVGGSQLQNSTMDKLKGSLNQYNISEEQSDSYSSIKDKPKIEEDKVKSTIPPKQNITETSDEISDAEFFAKIFSDTGSKEDIIDEYNSTKSFNLKQLIDSGHSSSTPTTSKTDVQKDSVIDGSLLNSPSIINKINDLNKMSSDEAMNIINTISTNQDLINLIKQNNYDQENLTDESDTESLGFNTKEFDSEVINSAKQNQTIKSGEKIITHYIPIN